MVYLLMIKNKQTNLDKPSLEETIKKIKEGCRKAQLARMAAKRQAIAEEQLRIEAEKQAKLEAYIQAVAEESMTSQYQQFIKDFQTSLISTCIGLTMTK